MNYKSVFYLLGKIIGIVGALMLLPLIVDVYYSMHGFSEAPYISFIIPILLCLVLSGLLSLNKPKQLKIFAKEGLVICGVGWILISAIGAIPFVISDAIPNYVDAFFESASGFTTTGSTILTRISILPKSILFWRSFTHWIGGMGILSFMLAIIPKATGNSMYVMKAEVPGPKAGKVTAKIGDSARSLYFIYTTITIMEIFILFIGGRITGDNIRFFDSVVTSFATAGTGGFSVLDNSILGYNSSFVEWVCIVFMFLFGVNFNLYYFIFIKRVSNIYKDEELRAYLLINLTGVAIIVINIMHLYSSFNDAIRDSFFAVNTVMSTTGFCTADFDTWPTLSKIVLVILMIVGSCAGSTGGGIKVSRIMLYAKQSIRDLRLMSRPNAVIKVRINKRVVESNVLKGVNAYLILYVIILIVSTVFVSFDGYSPTTSFTAVIACFNNIGPGLELVGPTGNFASFSIFSKIVLIFDMLAGRLEIFPILALISPYTWRKTK